jgi:AAA domain, putative AbiEii toxin, Type IV TA system
MKENEVPRLVGIGFKGFRDIRNPLLFAPWERLNILGGLNNSGKTSILRALDLAVNRLGSGGTYSHQAIPLGAIDITLMPDGQSPPTFSVGLAVAVDDVGGGPAFTFLGALSLGQIRSIDGTEQRNVEEFVDEAFGQFLSVSKGKQYVWVWLNTAEGGRLDDGFLESLNSAPYSAQVLQQLTRSGYSGDVSWQGLYNRFLTQSLELPKGVIAIGTHRKITSTGQRDRELKSADGAGLPDLLLALIAPEAEHFRESRARLGRLNELVADVLGVADAELLVPHNAQTVHVSMGDRVLPLPNLGSGIEQVVLLATICSSYTDHLVMIEEPELFLHPTLQRQLIYYLRERTTNTYVMATHSAALLDASIANVYRVSWSQESGTELHLISKPHQRAELAATMGFKASDLVQANAVIWVEGPSDRIYLRQWLRVMDPSLIEGVHYSFVLYGGRLAEHLTATELDSPVDGTISDERGRDLLEVLRINRNCVFVMDSDLTRPDQPLAGFKQRIAAELLDGGKSWVTRGAMIENYLEPDVFRDAYRRAHPRGVTSLTYRGELFENPFVGGVKQPDKVRIAEYAVSSHSYVPDRGDLTEEMAELVAYLQQVNAALRPSSTY